MLWLDLGLGGCGQWRVCAGGAAALASFRVLSLPRGTAWGTMPSVSTSETAMLAEEDECELEAKHRLLQMSLQVRLLTCTDVVGMLCAGEAEWWLMQRLHPGCA